MWETAEVRFSNLLNKSHKMLNISANTVRIFLKKTPRGHEANTFLMLPLVFSYIQRLLGFWWICYVKCIFCITFEVSAKIKKSLLGSPNLSNKSIVYKTTTPDIIKKTPEDELLIDYYDYPKQTFSADINFVLKALFYYLIVVF